ncbi:MAG: hypothetical protein J6Y97_02795, partial [Prevotella sp.]|nr:hypothetical protein [Prevotella sp.]
YLDYDVEERILRFTISDLHPIVKKKIAKLRELFNQKITKKKIKHTAINTHRTPVIVIPERESLSSLLKTQKGKRFSYTFICQKCGIRHTSGYLFVDKKGNEYEFCRYCCKPNNDYVKIIYTPTGNKR